MLSELEQLSYEVRSKLPYCPEICKDLPTRIYIEFSQLHPKAYLLAGTLWFADEKPSFAHTTAPTLVIEYARTEEFDQLLVSPHTPDFLRIAWTISGVTRVRVCCKVSSRIYWFILDPHKWEWVGFDD